MLTCFRNKVQFRRKDVMFLVTPIEYYFYCCNNNNVMKIRLPFPSQEHFTFFKESTHSKNPTFSLCFVFPLVTLISNRVILEVL